MTALTAAVNLLSTTVNCCQPAVSLLSTYCQPLWEVQKTGYSHGAGTLRLVHAHPWQPMPTQGAVQTVQSTPVRSYTARIALSRPDRATLPPSKPPTQSDLAGLQPLCLDEPALGRPGRSGALYTACNGFTFALQTPFYTRCAPAATPRPSNATPAGPPALVAQTPRFATKTPT